MGEMIKELADLFEMVFASIYWNYRKKHRIKSAWQIEHELYNEQARKEGRPEIDIKHLMGKDFIE